MVGVTPHFRKALKYLEIRSGLKGPLKPLKALKALNIFFFDFFQLSCLCLICFEMEIAMFTFLSQATSKRFFNIDAATLYFKQVCRRLSRLLSGKF